VKYDDYEYGFWRRYGEEHGTRAKPLSTAKDQLDAYAANLDRLRGLRANGLRDEPVALPKPPTESACVLVCPECSAALDTHDYDVATDGGQMVKRTHAYCSSCSFDQPLEVAVKYQPKEST
jgi:hypothetical protein